ncbi:hypothetical protein [Aneurinibacillus tyrosinisolvens]|uniref:hypothetical protein n=1 Tax=Aneurinibacillus tyrosinisolvens TaxID=1443435 RepID=UPI00063F890A|nr:hypothetical protein [Aneurinibacillus tyrosinisolvens]
MQQDIKAKYPVHCANEEKGKYKMMMSPDIDSFFSCAMLNCLMDYETKFFFNYGKLYAHESVDLKSFNLDQLLAVDLDVIYQYEKDKWIKCWGNHLTKMCPQDIENPECANLNQIVGAMRSDGNRITYSQKKRAISTAIQIASYYDLFRREDGSPKTLIESQKMFLWCVDAMFVAGKSESFGHMAKQFMKELDFECISDVLNKPRNDFYKFMDQYNITARNGRIWIDSEGYMRSTINLDQLQEEVFPRMDLSLPDGKFIEIASFRTPRISKNDNNLDNNKMKYVRKSPNLFTSVLPYKNQIRFSILEETKNGGEHLLTVR